MRVSDFYPNLFCENCVSFDFLGALIGGQHISDVTVAPFGWQDDTRFVVTGSGCEWVARFP
jgi:hypothetical protein